MQGHTAQGTGSPRHGSAGGSRIACPQGYILTGISSLIDLFNNFSISPTWAIITLYSDFLCWVGVNLPSCCHQLKLWSSVTDLLNKVSNCWRRKIISLMKQLQHQMHDAHHQIAAYRCYFFRLASDQRRSSFCQHRGINSSFSFLSTLMHPFESNFHDLFQKSGSVISS